MTSKKYTVLVTGANGYLASWIVKKLLLEGHTVHATVRDKHNKEKINHLSEYEKKYKGNIKFFSADLLEKNSFDELTIWLQKDLNSVNKIIEITVIVNYIIYRIF